MRIRVTAHPSLALVKYWGKHEGGRNLPSVPSLALTLEGLSTVTTVNSAPFDEIIINGQRVEDEKISFFLEHARALLAWKTGFYVETSNNFPTSAGLASSSSGFAALAAAILHLAQVEIGTPVVDSHLLSALARVGSGSASRAVFGGWTEWLAGAEAAQPFLDSEHWPEIRVLLFIVDAGVKPIGSREAMTLTRSTSPFFRAWVESSEALFQDAKAALREKNWEPLSNCARQSYLRMFATMFSSQPPVLYWQEETLTLIRLAEQLRSEGIQLFETMDAGPQVKYFCLERDLVTIQNKIREKLPKLNWLTARAGGPPRVEYLE